MDHIKSTEHMRELTIRLPEKLYIEVRDVAAENNISMAELVRLALSENLNKHLRSIKFIDHEQGEEIRKIALKTLDSMTNATNQIRRIGVNYNQDIRLKQLDRKYSIFGMDYEKIRQHSNEKEQILKECEDYSQEKFEAFVIIFKNSAKELTEAICRTLT